MKAMKRTHLFVILIGVIAIGIFTADASAMYHPGMGRFMQRDPGAGGEHRIGAGGPAATTGRFIPRDPTGSNQYADGMNLYQYVGSQPVNWVDPSGLIKGEGKYCKCGSGSGRTPWKTVEVAVVKMHGSTGDFRAHLKRAEDVYEQCCIFVANGTVYFESQQDTEKAIGTDLDVLVPSIEVKALTANQGKRVFARKGEIHAYYVKSITHGYMHGYAFPPSWYASPPAPAVLIANSAGPLTLAHELGHVLLDPGLPHSTDSKNLMYESPQKPKLTEAQCDRIRKSTYVR